MMEDEKNQAAEEVTKKKKTDIGWVILVNKVVLDQLDGKGRLSLLLVNPRREKKKTKALTYQHHHRQQ
jgi:hypothetical protein